MPVASLQSRTILCGGGRRHYFHGPMPLGVRTFFGGTARYQTERGAYAVEEGTWFVVNDRQPYTIAFDLPQPIQSFVVFFPTGWAGDVARNLTTAPGRLLDTPEADPGPVDFFETVAPGDALVLPRLLALRAACRGRRVEDGWLEEKLHGLLGAMLLSQREHLRAAGQLPAVRAATRAELYRRLCRGRDYLRAYAASAPALSDAARAACLSPFHFQRSFKAVFGESPHAFVTRCRLERARQLVAGSGLRVTEVAAAVGYESVGAFHRAFRLRFAAAPSAFRKN